MPSKDNAVNKRKNIKFKRQNLTLKTLFNRFTHLMPFFPFGEEIIS